MEYTCSSLVEKRRNEKNDLIRWSEILSNVALVERRRNGKMIRLDERKNELEPTVVVGGNWQVGTVRAS